MIQPIDYFLVVWFALAAVSTAYVGWDQYRNNPEPNQIKTVRRFALSKDKLVGFESDPHRTIGEQTRVMLTQPEQDGCAATFASKFSRLPIVRNYSRALLAARRTGAL